MFAFPEFDEAAECIREFQVLDGAAVDLEQPRRACDVARHCARETATFSRLRDMRKSSPRGTSSPLDDVIE